LIIKKFEASDAAVKLVRWWYALFSWGELHEVEEEPSTPYRQGMQPLLEGVGKQII